MRSKNFILFCLMLSVSVESSGWSAVQISALIPPARNQNTPSSSSGSSGNPGQTALPSGLSAKLVQRSLDWTFSFYNIVTSANRAKRTTLDGGTSLIFSTFYKDGKLQALSHGVAGEPIVRTAAFKYSDSGDLADVTVGARTVSIKNEITAIRSSIAHALKSYSPETLRIALSSANGQAALSRKLTVDTFSAQDVLKHQLQAIANDLDSQAKAAEPKKRGIASNDKSISDFIQGLVAVASATEFAKAMVALLPAVNAPSPFLNAPSPFLNAPSPFLNAPSNRASAVTGSIAATFIGMVTSAGRDWDAP